MTQPSPSTDLTLICDLDGVVYRGREEVPGSRDALLRLGESGVRVVFVTNNSTRTPAQVASKLFEVVGLEPEERDIVTSAQAAASAIPAESRNCYVIGGEGLRAAVEGTGRNVVPSDQADCVIVGIAFDFRYDQLEAAATAIRGGAAFVASNLDPTFPMENGVLRPGAGSIVAAVATAADVEPVVAGKPNEPVRRLLRERGVRKAVVVGDRVDTDIALATEERDWSSILVLSGVTAGGDSHEGADLVSENLSSAVDLVLEGALG